MENNRKTAMEISMHKQDQLRQVRLIVTDLDDTVLNSRKEIGEKTRKAFAACREAGFHLAVATARHPKWLGEYREALGIDYEVTTDGTYVLQSPGKEENFSFAPEKDRVVHCCGFSREEAISLVACLRRKKGCGLIRTVWQEDVFSDETPEQIQSHSGVLLKLVAVLPDEDTARETAEEAGCKYIHYRGEDRYSFIKKEAGKKQGLIQLAQELAIGLENIMVFGDDYNDLEMIQSCGVGIAVENAKAQVKAAADFVVKNCEQEGVAEFLFHFLDMCAR